jgi:hypothetical protein
LTQATAVARSPQPISKLGRIHHGPPPSFFCLSNRHWAQAGWQSPKER